MKKLTVLYILFILAGCTKISLVESDEFPEIFPDYVGVTIPEGLADLRFRMCDGRPFKVSEIRRDSTLWIQVSAWDKDTREGISYAPFPVHISSDAIDPYIAYRLIEPGYESWSEMGIYQRELATYKEKTITTNKINDKGCINCHSFENKSPEHFLFHARGNGGGTVFVNGNNIQKVNLATIGPMKQGTYPAWNPDGRYVAFSSNTTQQCFMLDGSQPIEVYDTESDIIILDTQSGEILADQRVCGGELMETFPCWSDDGKTLFYCAADSTSDVSNNRGQIHYKLMSIDFDCGEFTGDPVTVWEDKDASASFPRVCGDWLLFTKSDFGTFPIWHKEADLYLINLKTGETHKAEGLNSDGTESYHSWSSNGKWVVFSSRRLDDRYTRLFISHFDGNGNFSKPFLLPQEKPEMNDLRLKSYNIPEFIQGEVSVSQKALKELFK